MKNLKMAALVLLSTVSLGASAQNFENVAGCSAEKFVQGTENNQIGTSGFSYTPKCLKVKIGSQVTIKASGMHPLTAMPNIQDAVNPFSNGSSFTAPQTRVMDTVGTYGYFCNHHGDSAGGGMAGVIVVEL